MGLNGHGEYEEVKGFEAQHLGHTITAVFDPDSVSATGFISVFAEPQEAAEFLTYKRGRERFMQEHVHVCLPLVDHY